METELFADKWKKGEDWEGYEVYLPIRKRRICLGYPFVVLVKDKQVRCSTPEESLEILNRRIKQNQNIQKSTNILDGKLSD